MDTEEAAQRCAGRTETTLIAPDADAVVATSSALPEGGLDRPLQESGLDRESLLALPPAARRPALAGWLRAEVARLVRVPAARLARTASPLAAGLDSLAAVELKSAIEAAFGS